MDRAGSEHWKKLNEHYAQATTTGSEHLHISIVASTELKKLKSWAVPSNITSSLLATNVDIFPNTQYLLCVLAEFPVTTFTAERCISSLRCLKTYLRSATGQDRLTGLALTHIHLHIPVDVDGIVSDFSLLYPRRMKLKNILKD